MAPLSASAYRGGNFQLHSLCIWMLTQQPKAKPGAREENKRKMYAQASTKL
jgi:hypothetical protein